MEEEAVKRPSGHEVGMAIDLMSVDELEQRIALLETEIQRLRAAIHQRHASRVAADALFKF